MARQKARKKKQLVKVVCVEITQNKMMKTVAEVPQWEAHVLLALWGEEARPTGDPKYVKRVVPDAADEMQRLADKYGPKDEDTKVVNRVYGAFGPGLRALANEIDLCIAGGGKPENPEVKPLSEHAGSLGVDLQLDNDEDEDPDTNPLSDEEIAALDNAVPTVAVTDPETGEVIEAETFGDLT